MDEGTTATRQEVEQAIKSLSHADLLRLRRFAMALVKGLGRARQGRDHEDLLQEAIASFLEGTENGGTGRCWNMNIEFRTALCGAMRSIASHWKEKYSCRQASLESDLPNGGPEVANGSPFEGSASRATAADDALCAQQEADRIMHLFRHDFGATQVLHGWTKGMTGPEIMKAAGITEQEYAAAVKRIRNHPHVLGLGRPRRKRGGK
jgi:DNA-directed RNA polymerase specialized sigma24 family protein